MTRGATIAILPRAMTRGGRFASCALAALSVFGWSAPAAQLQGNPDEGSHREWVIADDFVVEIDGAPAPDAKLYRSQGRSSLLFVEPSIPAPLMLNPRSRTYSPVDASQLSAGGERSVVLPDAAVLEEEHDYTMESTAVVVEWRGRRIRISAKPPLVGETTLEEVLRHSPVYKDGMDSYEPGAQDVTWLKGLDDSVRVEIFFGTWCPHCREMVPKMLKFLSEVSNDHIALDLKGVPPPPFSAYPAARDAGIRGVPTFIIHAGGREIGRFSGIPVDSTVEHELVKILAAWRAARG